VLNRLDSDAEAARALNLQVTLAQPFSPVGPNAIQEALKMVDAADTVILSQVPIGSGNLINLELAQEALKRGKTVLLAAGMADRDYTEGKAAVQFISRLMKDGALEWTSIQELMLHLQKHTHS
ncbi:MAG: ABC transporter ATP-binding protein, partial [Chlorobiales bacterium]|nr:ABC transporter ATP-binding protein [Chlorobiales bacterium]